MKNLLVLLAGLAALTAIISCGQGQSTLQEKKAAIEKLKSEQAAIEDKIKTLELEIAKMGDSAIADDSKSKFIAVTPLLPQIFEHSIDVQGSVEGDENVTLTAKMAGSINKVYVKAGDEVKQGQTLAEIEHEIID
ncbi:MAG: biotin/lipoyl-binding protein, partial [Bacteroidota bacterium]